MGEILEKGQIINIVPLNFRNSNKGKIIDFVDREFHLESFHNPDEIPVNKLIEFYSQSKHGMLYFSSTVTKIEGNLLTVRMPIKHRFLQRRAYTRVKYTQNIEFKTQNDSYQLQALDLSAGGMKLRTNASINIDQEYDMFLKLSSNKGIKCQFQPIRVEKNDTGFYTVSGRFNNLSNTDKMTCIQFCMKKNIENMNK